MKKLLFASVVLVPVVSSSVVAQDMVDRMGSRMGDRMSEIGAATASRFTETETQKIKDFFNKRASDLQTGQRAGRDEAQDDDDDDEHEKEEKDKEERAKKNKSTDKESKGKGKSNARGRGNGRGNGRGAQADQGGRPSLPPGIAKNLERGKKMPPGIARNYLPSGLDDGLPVREGQSRVVVDDDVVLVDNETDVIIDVIEDVLGGVMN